MTFHISILHQNYLFITRNFNFSMKSGLFLALSKFFFFECAIFNNIGL